MRFKEIATRLTGFSTPIFGISWNPDESDITVARRVIAFLEDRRVLYVPSEMEVPDHCVQSVLQIRDFLTKEIGSIERDSELRASLKAMRAACRKFLQAIDYRSRNIIPFGSSQGHYASWIFQAAIGELRGVFGVHLARLAAQHGLDIDDELPAILPAKDASREV